MPAVAAPAHHRCHRHQTLQLPVPAAPILRMEHRQVTHQQHAAKLGPPSHEPNGTSRCCAHAALQ